MSDDKKITDFQSVLLHYIAQWLGGSVEPLPDGRYGFRWLPGDQREVDGVDYIAQWLDGSVEPTSDGRYGETRRDGDQREVDVVTEQLYVDIYIPYLRIAELQAVMDDKDVARLWADILQDYINTARKKRSEELVDTNMGSIISFLIESAPIDD